MDRVTAYAPGSTSNLGPGFDCLGVAITGLGDQVTAVRVNPPGVRVRSVSDPRVPLDALRNTAALAASEVCRRVGAGALGLELEIVKGLPLAGGLGGSAASAVAGAVAANALLGRPLADEIVLECALEAEVVVAGRHPDNVAPSLYGGAVLVLGVHPLCYARLTVHPRLRLVFATPAYGVETSEARRVLPSSVERADAVAQAAALAGLILGLERGDGDLIRRSMVDRIAEPHRIPLYPGYPEAREAALDAGAFGVAVSGAGPTLVAVTAEGSEAEVSAAVTAVYGRLGHPARTHVARVDSQGARLT
jgi:homoserine kinase